jgi:hypothetical protein
MIEDLKLNVSKHSPSLIRCGGLIALIRTIYNCIFLWLFSRNDLNSLNDLYFFTVHIYTLFPGTASKYATSGVLSHPSPKFYTHASEDIVVRMKFCPWGMFLHGRRSEYLGWERF